MRCGICQFPVCNEDCLQGLEHVKICAYLKGIGAQVTAFDKPYPVYDAIVPLKLLVMKKTNPKAYHFIDKLMDHKEQRKAFPDYWKMVKTNIVDLIMAIPGLNQDIDEEDIFKIVGILDTNTHEISNRNGCCYRGLFPLVAILSHRCVTNSRQIMVKEKPYGNTCRSTVFIPKGSEIFTTYIWPHLSTRRRRHSLSEGWHFSCTCFRCSDPAELGALTSAVLCKVCNSGYLLHENPLEDHQASMLPEEWKCQDCGNIGDAEAIAAMLEKFDGQVENLSRYDLEGNLAALKKLRQFLHCNHAILTELRTRIIPIFTRQPGKTTHDFPDETLDAKRQLCRENLKVLNVVSPGLTIQRGGVLFELQECDFFLAKRKAEEGLMSEPDLLNVMKNCKRILLECRQCLTKERSNSLEQYYEKSSMVSLKAICNNIAMFS